MSSDTSQLQKLFDTIRHRFPESISPNGWYTLTGSALITISNPANINFLYKYLISQPEWTSNQQRRILSRRMREQMLKQWTTIGIPRVITAVRAIATIEAPEDADPGSTEKYFRVCPENESRGRQLCESIYGKDQYSDIMASWGSMRSDFTWVGENIIYGMFLSDEEVMNGVETALMSYSSMACMGLLGTSRRHLTGLINLGVAEEDCVEVIACTKILAEWAGIETNDWVTMENLKREPPVQEMHDLIRIGQI